MPDISKWDTDNAKDMNEIFSECSRLSELPDISRWNTYNAFNLGGILFKCESLTVIIYLKNEKRFKLSLKVEI